jgi:hypothetical protein
MSEHGENREPLSNPHDRDPPERIDRKHEKQPGPILENNRSKEMNSFRVLRLAREHSV